MTPPGLYIIWSSADREVALNMVFMYGLNSKRKGWWDQVRLIIWGPSAKLAAGDQNIQRCLAEMKEAGVELLACKACSDKYGPSDKIADLGVEVIYVGQTLTEMLKSGWAGLTF